MPKMHSLKRALTTLGLVFTVLSALAQGTFTVTLSGANEVPPTGSTRIGSGNLSLNSTALDYTVAFSATADVPTDVAINGPANTASTAPVLFDLGAPFFIVPNPPLLPWAVTGTINNLTSTQVNDLLAGLWYVHVFSSPSSYPGGEIRGQISAVPEPPTLGLLGVAGAFLVARAFRGRKGSLALVVGSLCLVVSVSEATAQGAIDSATTTGPVTVAPGGTPAGQFVAPWVDVSPTMPYVDGLPVFKNRHARPSPALLLTRAFRSFQSRPQ